MTHNDKETLELIIDQHGLAGIFDAIADICHEKASHIESNWQDRLTARAWDSAGKKTAKLSHNVLIKELSEGVGA